MLVKFLLFLAKLFSFIICIGEVPIQAIEIVCVGHISTNPPNCKNPINKSNRIPSISIHNPTGAIPCHSKIPHEDPRRSNHRWSRPPQRAAAWRRDATAPSVLGWEAWLTASRPFRWVGKRLFPKWFLIRQDVWEQLGQS